MKSKKERALDTILVAGKFSRCRAVIEGEYDVLKFYVIFLWFDKTDNLGVSFIDFFIEI